MADVQSLLQFSLLEQDTRLGIRNTGAKISFKCYQSQNFGFQSHKTNVAKDNSLPEIKDPIIAGQLDYEQKNILCSPVHHINEVSSN